MASKVSSDYKFISEPPTILKCVICLRVSRLPKQHEDCGKLFCRECIESNEYDRCPNCKKSNPQYFNDRKSHVEITELPVRCDNVERGCAWEGTVGTIETHVTKCGFTLISCPNECNDDDEGLQLMRKDLDNHLRTKCPNRDYNCEHCGEKGKHANINKEHDKICMKKVVDCPNLGCFSTMERGKIEQHIRSVCKFAMVTCKYKSIGCKVHKVRMYMKQHEEEDMKTHLHLAMEKITKLDHTVSSLINKNVKTLTNEDSMTFRLPGYGAIKKNSEKFASEPFYTSSGGYKMFIRVHANGYADGKGTHVSIYAKLLKGSNDDILLWPFLGSVKFELLNQLADENHHTKVLEYEASDNAQVDSGWGYSKFIHHSMLSYDLASNTQYLMEDTLYFRVSVIVHNHKPWLDCPHHTE